MVKIILHFLKIETGYLVVKIIKNSLNISCILKHFEYDYQLFSNDSAISKEILLEKLLGSEIGGKNTFLKDKINTTFFI